MDKEKLICGQCLTCGSCGVNAFENLDEVMSTKTKKRWRLQSGTKCWHYLGPDLKGEKCKRYHNRNESSVKDIASFFKNPAEAVNKVRYRNPHAELDRWIDPFDFFRKEPLYGVR